MLDGSPLENGQTVYYNADIYRLEKSKPQNLRIQLIADSDTPLVNDGNNKDATLDVPVIEYDKDSRKARFKATDATSGIYKIVYAPVLDLIFGIRESIKEVKSEDIRVSGDEHDGMYEITLPEEIAKKPSQDYLVAVIDKANNSSQGTFKATVDEVSVDQPTVETITDTTVVVKGHTTEPNMTVHVGRNIPRDNDPDKVDFVKFAEGTSDENGNFAISIPAQDAGVKLAFIVRDEFGNASEPLEVEVVSSNTQTEKPEKPEVNEVQSIDEFVTGKSIYKDATIVVEKEGTELSRASSDHEGYYNVSIAKQEVGTKLGVYVIRNGVKSELTEVVVKKAKLEKPTINDKESIDDSTDLIEGSAFRPGIEVVLVKVNEDGSEELLETTTADPYGEYEIAFTEQPLHTKLAVYSRSDSLESKREYVTVGGELRKPDEYGNPNIVIEKPELLTGYNAEVPFVGRAYGIENLDRITIDGKEIPFTTQEDTSVKKPGTDDELFYGRVFDFDTTLELEEGFYEKPIVLHYDNDKTFAVTRRFWVDKTAPKLDITSETNEVKTVDDSYVIYTDKPSVHINLLSSDNMSLIELKKNGNTFSTKDQSSTKGLSSKNIKHNTKDIVYPQIGENTYTYGAYDIGQNETLKTLKIVRTDKSILKALTEQLEKSNKENKDDLLARAKDAISKEDISQEDIESLENEITDFLDEEVPQEPVLRFVSDLDVYKNQVVDRNYLLRAVQAHDYQDGDITSKITLSLDSIDTSEVKTVPLTYTVVDENGNTVEKTINVNVLDDRDNEVDKMELRNLMARSYALIDSDFTKESIDKLNEVLEKADLVLKNEDATQEEVDQMVMKLKEAWEDLVDLTELKAALFRSNKITPEELSTKTNKSVKELFDSIVHAKEVVNKDNATKEEVAEATKRLNDAIANLKEKPKTNTEELKSLYNEVSGIDEELYTPKTKAPFKEAREKAKEVLENDESTQEEIDNAYASLKESYDNLEKKPNKTDLKMVYDTLSDMEKTGYTKESLKELDRTLKLAKAALEDENATEREVHTAYVNMLFAKYNLEHIVVNKDRLINKYLELEKIDREIYTKESLDELDKAMKDALDVIHDKNASEEKVRDQLLILELTANNLKVVKKDTSTDTDDLVVVENKKTPEKNANSKDDKVVVSTKDPDNSSSVKLEKLPLEDTTKENTVKTSKQAKTGVTSLYYLIVVIVVLSIAVFFIRRKKGK